MAASTPPFAALAPAPNLKLTICLVPFKIYSAISSPEASVLKPGVMPGEVDTLNEFGKYVTVLGNVSKMKTLLAFPAPVFVPFKVYVNTSPTSALLLLLASATNLSNVIVGSFILITKLKMPGKY